MSDFSSTEKVNHGWKHLFGILGTSNGDGSNGKTWFEEINPDGRIIYTEDIWSDNVPYANNLSEAKFNSGSIVEDRSDGVAITLAANGSDWNINVTFEPKIGYQITDVHPNATYIKSITGVVNNGGGSYTITLDSNSGVTAGSAVLQRRIFLTEDISTNGLAWFARTIQSNSFSNIIENYIQPQKSGVGYMVRVFQSDGTEILTTEGAWIFNWRKGLLLFGDNLTPDDLGYSKPIYIETFRYIGQLGSSSPLSPTGDLNDTLRFNGSSFVANNTVKADGINLNVLNRLTISGSIVVPSGLAPSFSGSSGDQGEVRWDSKFLYVKTEKGWARSTLNYF